jgi:hypothetical protein
MIEQKPFRQYNEKKADTFTTRLNENERKKLNIAKVLLDIDKDSTALKLLAWIGLNVLNTTFSPKLIKYLSSSKRNRLSDTDLYDSILKNL